MSANVITCPDWCELPQDEHTSDPLAPGWTIHYGPSFGILKASQGFVGSEPSEPLRVAVPDQVAFDSHSDLLALAMSAVEAATWLAANR